MLAMRVNIVGLTPENGRKLVITIAAVVLITAAQWVIGRVLRRIPPADKDRSYSRVRFFSREIIRILGLVLIVAVIVTVWFDNPGRFATAAGLITAGVAVALQRVVTSFAAYFMILRGRVFTVGDRITMGGVRGDVVELGFTQTTVMEMGEPFDSRTSDPAVWVSSRQYTGRIVRVTNDRIFDSPVYNYTREFPYLWEEMRLPIRYDSNADQVEKILLDAALKHTEEFAAKAEAAANHLRDRYVLRGSADTKPHVYYRLTDNWLEMALRFVVPEHGIRPIKDQISREILSSLNAARITLASATYEITGVAPLRIEQGAESGKN